MKAAETEYHWILTVFVPSTNSGWRPKLKSFFPENTSNISFPLNTAIFGLNFCNFSNNIWLPEIFAEYEYFMLNHTKHNYLILTNGMWMTNCQKRSFRH